MLMKPVNTIALEVVPTSKQGGQPRAIEEARKVKTLLDKSGLTNVINTFLVPQIIAEEGDRPIALDEKMDPLDTREALAMELPISFIFTQVTVFTPLDKLTSRLKRVREAGVGRVVFVGVPRVFDEKDIVGPFPSEALGRFKEIIPSRGVILIPTRPDEDERFQAKLDSGANFALSQLLFSDQIVPFLRKLEESPQKPEILLSFGYVPQVELKVGLMRWLIRDISPGAQTDSDNIERLAGSPFNEKRRSLVELYKRVVEGATKTHFPIGVHFECPYGVSEPALETFSAMLDFWSPGTG